MQQPVKSLMPDAAKSAAAPYRAWLSPANAGAMMICLVGAGALLWILRAEHPAQSGIFPPCPFHFLTGFYCPGCGALRTIHYLSNGRALSALDSNFLVVAFLPLLTWAFFSHILIAAGKKPLPGAERLLNTSWPILLTIIFVFWIARNLPFFPFNLLAP
ncbi:MAG: DUF2752 domain-containing protein [Desulfatibacillaceae bacterium]|nr:DUF2752 domain-containing protein [Desulfatibacillaceae bacterium]